MEALRAEREQIDAFERAQQHHGEEEALNQGISAPSTEQGPIGQGVCWQGAIPSKLKAVLDEQVDPHRPQVVEKDVVGGHTSLDEGLRPRCRLGKELTDSSARCQKEPPRSFKPTSFFTALGFVQVERKLTHTLVLTRGPSQFHHSMESKDTSQNLRGKKRNESAPCSKEEISIVETENSKQASRGIHSQHNLKWRLRKRQTRCNFDLDS